MHRFDYSFLADTIPAGLLSSATLISELKTKEIAYKDKHGSVFKKLESIAIVQSVKGSNAIEGIATTDKRIEAIVNQNSAPLGHNESEIAGYRDALALIHQNYADLSISEAVIKQLHEILLTFTPAIGGFYKETDNAIIEIDGSGNRFIRFMPISASQTESAMEQLMLAFIDAQFDTSINQLLLIPCFILDFLCIHPFYDGNGRISRLLSLLLLYKHGFDAGRYISFEEQIYKSRTAYYDSLHESSIGWHENESSYFPFIQNFLNTLLVCYVELDKRFALLSTGNVSKTQRIEAAVINSLLPISKSEIAYILPDVSISTIEAALARMLKRNEIKKLGSGPTTKYIKI